MGRVWSEIVCSGTARCGWVASHRSARPPSGRGTVAAGAGAGAAAEAMGTAADALGAVEEEEEEEEEEVAAAAGAGGADGRAAAAEAAAAPLRVGSSDHGTMPLPPLIIWFCMFCIMGMII